jgi:REP element-mobilizing transposase RayT
MSRPLRIVLADAWYQIVSRGNRRAALFLNDADRRGFLGRLAELPERFGIEIHAFVLMDNHYHLLLRTTEANLSHAIRWLNVSYSTRFNWAHRQCGHVFQGRFKSVLIEEERGVAEVARYLHLNPVRVEGLGLGKDEQRAAKVMGCPDPGAELVARRLGVLRDYPWSSWRVYSGAERAPEWMATGLISCAYGGRSRAEQRAALQEHTEMPVRQGHLESPWVRLVGGLVLGDEGFAKQLLAGRKVNLEEQTEARRLRRRVPWEAIVKATEKARGRTWDEMLVGHGEWGRDGAMYYAVRHGGHRLVEVVAQAGGLHYQAAAQAVKRFAARLEREANPRRFVEELKRQLSNM